MSPNAETPFVATILDDIEKRVDEIFSAQKDEVEQSLVERINREKEEAQKRIAAVNQEFAQVRGFLEEHKTVMTGLQTLEEHLRGEIRGHFERAVNYQKMMEHAAILAGGELEKIGGLNGELDKLRARAEAEYTSLKDRLAGYAGISVNVPAPTFRTEGEVDWTEEIGKLRKVRDLLATLRQAETPDGDETGNGSRTAETAEELAASLGLIGSEEDGVRDDADFAAGDRGGSGAPLPESWPSMGPAPLGVEVETAPAVAETEAAFEPASQPVEEAPMPIDGCQFSAPEAEPEPVPEPTPAGLEKSEADARIQEKLARYRRSEPINNGIEIAFFASDKGTFLDAGSFMAAIAKILDAANQLQNQLGQTTSVKDLFLLKQEILNQQEVLRKLFFRVVRFCEKEGGRLPAALGEIIGTRGLKDIIERLTMANWSDPSDFQPFLSELKALSRAYEAKTGAAENALQAILDEVEGREN